MISPEGGKLIRTRNYTSTENSAKINEVIRVGATTQIPEAEISATFKGLQYNQAGNLHSENQQ